MSSEGPDTQELADGIHEPRECMACRGTGRVISNLGGSSSTVDCPWCSGSGLRPGEIDAQEHWGEASGEVEQATGGGQGTEPGTAKGADDTASSAGS